MLPGRPRPRLGDSLDRQAPRTTVESFTFVHGEKSRRMVQREPRKRVWEPATVATGNAKALLDERRVVDARHKEGQPDRRRRGLS